jgi:hypothetical protein
MRARNSVFAELESAIKSGSREKRIESLRLITDLFLSDVDRFNEEQISVFDDVLCHLIKRIETIKPSISSFIFLLTRRVSSDSNVA